MTATAPISAYEPALEEAATLTYLPSGIPPPETVTGTLLEDCLCGGGYIQVRGCRRKFAPGNCPLADHFPQRQPSLHLTPSWPATTNKTGLTMQIRIHEPKSDEYLAAFNALDSEQQQEHLNAGNKQMLAEFVAMARRGYGPGADAEAWAYFSYAFVYRVHIGRRYAEVTIDLRHPAAAKMRHLGLALQAVSEKIEMEAFMDEFRREFPL